MKNAKFGYPRSGCKIKNFKNCVYKVVKRIPPGETLTYKKVAELAGRPRAWRAAGNILNKNRDWKTPCHRVIRVDGKIGGYSQGQRKKIILLKKEGIIIEKSKFQNPKTKK